MKYAKATYRLTGVAPLILHSGDLANPLNPIVREMKKITSKSKKTDADQLQISKLEFLGGLYHDPKLGVFIPHDCIEAGLIGAARKLRKGQIVKAAVFVEEPAPLMYDGPRTPDALWADERFRLVKGVKVQKARVMRCRPMFSAWSVEPVVTYDRSALNPGELEELFTIFGTEIGLCDWRPRYGRFSSKKLSDELVAVPLAA